VTKGIEETKKGVEVKIGGKVYNVPVMDEAEWRKAFKAGIAPKEVYYKGSLAYDYFKAYLTEEEKKQYNLTSGRKNGKERTLDGNATVGQMIALHRYCNVDTTAWTVSKQDAFDAIANFKRASSKTAKETLAKRLIKKYAKAN
jgi:hypothetical protein